MLNKNIILYVLSISVALLLVQCAQRGTLTGGPRDSSPPQLNIGASTPNDQVNFKKQDIRLVFDEYVNLSNKVSTEVVISPPLKYRPKIRAEDKTVIFSFDKREELRTDVTYNIAFGGAIQDYTEGNTAKNIHYTFSTGAVIDSLVIRGQVTDASTGKGVGDGKVMLYDDLRDSIARKEIPLYFANTNPSGQFSINHVKPGTYQVVAIVEKNTNFKLDNPSERVGFLEEVIFVTATEQPKINIQVFDQPVPNIITKIDSSQYGKLRIQTNGNPQDVKIENIPNRLNTSQTIDKDTLIFWHNTAENTSWKAIISLEGKQDTIEVNGKGRAAFIAESTLGLETRQDKDLIDFHPLRPLTVVFNYPLDSIHPSQIQLSYIDSLGNTLLSPKLAINEEDPSQLEVYYEWQQDTIYELLILPKGVSSSLGVALTDTIRQEYRPLPVTNYGNLIMQFEGIDKEANYWVELMYNRDNLVMSFPVIKDTVFVKKVMGLPAGDYLLNIVEDLNENRRWDTGNYDEKKQPERQKIRTLEPIRGGWDVEAVIDLSDLFTGVSLEAPIDTSTQK